MMCIRTGNYVRCKMMKKSPIVLGNTESPTGVSQLARREG